MNSIMAKIISLFTGGKLTEELFGLIKDYFPSEQTKADAKLKIMEFAHQKQIDAERLSNQAIELFNQRVKDLEGTATDLKSLPIIGSLMLFIRGAQRPIWGFFTMYADFMAFSGGWEALTQKQEAMLYVVNFLVLGFLFGERTVINVLPFLKEFLGKKNGNDA